MAALKILCILLLILQMGFIQRSHMAVIAKKEATCDVVQTPTEDGTTSGDVTVAAFSASKYRATKFVYTGTNGKAICKVDLWLEFVGSSTHNYYCAIWGHDAGSDEPQDTDVQGTSDVQDLSSIGGSEVQVSFEFSTPTSGLTNSSTYWVVLYSSTADASNYVEWNTEASGTTERTMYDGDGDNWTLGSSTTTRKFKLYSQ